MRIAPHPAPGRWPNLRPRFPARSDPAPRHDGAAASETRIARSVREVLEAGITYFRGSYPRAVVMAGLVPAIPLRKANGVPRYVQRRRQAPLARRHALAADTRREVR